MVRILIALFLGSIAGCSTVSFQYDPYMIYKYRYETWETTEALTHRYICVDGYTNCNVFIGHYTCQCGDYLF